MLAMFWLLYSNKVNYIIKFLRTNNIIVFTHATQSDQCYCTIIVYECYSATIIHATLSPKVSVRIIDASGH